MATRNPRNCCLYSRCVLQRMCAIFVLLYDIDLAHTSSFQSVVALILPLLEHLNLFAKRLKLSLWSFPTSRSHWKIPISPALLA